jgi:uncharacterized protein
VEDRPIITRRGMQQTLRCACGLLALVVACLALPWSGPQAPQAEEAVPAADPPRQFFSRILGSTEVAWRGIFEKDGRNYREPKLVLFSDATGSGCGPVSATRGPFYCAADQSAYVDPSFFGPDESHCDKTCQFARAYVIAHLVGHHVQTLLGQGPDTDQSGTPALRELQADCFAGLWAGHPSIKPRIEPGDVQAAMRMAAAINDEGTKREGSGGSFLDFNVPVDPNERERWFNIGFNGERLSDCGIK